MPDASGGRGSPPHSTDFRKRVRSWPALLSILAHVAIGIALFVRVEAAPPPLIEIDLVPSAAIQPAVPRPKKSREDAPRPVDEPREGVTRPVPPSHRLVSDQRQGPALRTRPDPPSRIRVPDPGNSISSADIDAATPSGIKPANPTPPAPPAPPPPDYIALIRGRLEQLKRYPAEARAARQVGVVLLGFTLDRTGLVLNWRIVRASGIPALDQETGDLIQRASPFPPFPSSYGRQNIHITIPVEFSLTTP